MPHPNAQRYLDMMAAGPPDPSRAGEWMADDVVWYEAGNPTPFVGPDAVFERIQDAAGAEPIDMQADTVLADDDNVVVVGTARFARGDDSVSYRFVEHYTLVDGKVVERRSYMDAVPADVATFFGS